MMKVTGNKRRWWQFGCGFSKRPESERDSGKLSVWTRRLLRAAAVLIGCSAFVLILTGSAYVYFITGPAGQAVPLVCELGSCAGACLLMVLYARTFSGRGLKARVLVLLSAVLAGLGMAWLLQTFSLPSLLVTLAALALLIHLAWTELEPNPRALSRGPGLFVHVASTAVWYLVNGASLLCVALYLVFLVSTPFRPLAIQPPPAEWVARYVPTVREPSAGGTAYRMLMGLEEATYRERYGITNAIIPEGWRERWESFGSDPSRANGVTMQNLYEQAATSRWDRVTAGAADVDGALDALLPPIEALADVSVGEKPAVGVLPKDSNPFVCFVPNLRPLLYLMPMEAVRRIDRGETGAARAALLRQIKLNAYMLRGQTRIDRLFSKLMAQRLAHIALRLGETRGGITPPEARALEAAIVEAGVGVPPMTVSLREANDDSLRTTRYLYRSDVRCRALRKAFGLSQPQAKSNGMGESPESPVFGSPLSTLTTFLKYSFWLGNDRSGVLQSSENIGLWNMVRAGVALDPAGPDPDEVERQAWAAMGPPWVVLRRGWNEANWESGCPDFYCTDSQIYAHFAAARTALMLSAFWRETGRDAGTLEEVAERFGWKVPCHPLTEIPVTFTRLVPPVKSEEGAFAYALACWSDGRAVKPGGGTVWLVVRNPAFGELPFRVCHWDSAGGEMGGVLTHEIVLTQAPLAEKDAKGRLPRLEIPVGLLQEDSKVWDAEWTAMKRAGWEW